MTALSMDQLTPWVLATSLSIAQIVFRLIVILLIGYLAVRFLTIGIRHLETILLRAAATGEVGPEATRKRVATLGGVIRTIALALIWGIVIILVLDQVGLDIRPILAGAGILGLAVGFGAQNLIRDLISGFFMILENQVRVGDVAVINGTGGLVETITFRTIVLRDFSQVVHIFPNGSINTISNMTMGWSAFVLDMGVAYKEDTDRVAQIMLNVGGELQRDPVYGPKFLEPTELIGVENFADSAVVVRIRIKTLPIEQWNVGREYRRRLKKAFDAQGIEIPFPHRSLYVGEASRPFRVEVLQPSAPPASSPSPL